MSTAKTILFALEYRPDLDSLVVTIEPSFGADPVRVIGDVLVYAAANCHKLQTIVIQQSEAT